ncbi:hypothetical protein MB02_00130 [Croceicoccus estronivorus]|uniref:hypothetical protein n=1 Tax=Croceicoccus estronivorus TaxID=1172626 RepID=UPI00082ADB9E|nr:hypothetical protein [Croceicoccus estronivorus]OCC25144.1 hypothetical protein MB02_00130 [Croceicoccus estronivorus]
MSQDISYDDFDALAAIEARGFTPWGPPLTIGLEAVKAFQDVTGAQSENGHIPGVMLQAMLPRLVPALDWSVTGHSGAINLGSPSIRYPVRIQCGAQLCGRSRLASAKAHPKGTLIALEFEVRGQDTQKPCLKSTIELLYLEAKR